MKKVLLFCHGWGFSSDYWVPLLPFIEEYSIHFWDLGYFGKPCFDSPKINEEFELWGVGHSLGFSILLFSPLLFKGIIGLNPFLKFNKGPEKIPLQKTILAAKKDPFEMLKQFYLRCGMAKGIDALMEKKAFMRPERLASDLLLLEHLDLEKIFQERALPCKILASVIDPIISFQSVDEDFQKFPQVETVLTTFAKHNLGFHEAKWTSDEIRKFIRL